MFKKLILLYVFLIPPALYQAQKAKFVTKQTGASIKVLKRKVTQFGSAVTLNTKGVFQSSYQTISLNNVNPNKTDTLFIGIDSGFYKCNTEETLLLLEKEKHKSKTQLVNLTQIKKSKNRLVLDKLEPLPIRKKEDAEIIIESIAVNVLKSSLIQKNYDSYSDYLKKNEEHTYFSDRQIIYKNTIFRSALENFLVTTGHSDTLDKLDLNIYSKISLNLTIKKIIEHKFNGMCVVELNTVVKFPEFFGENKELDYYTKSYIGFDESEQDEANNLPLINDALENVILEVLKDEKVKENFINPEAKYKKISEANAEIIYTNTSTAEPNLEDATSAVVTITQKGSHGSGCIISNNGYIITNYHVTGTDTSEIYAIFNSESKKRCRFIRGNATYDLALLQVDTSINVPLKINNSKKISIGADVYAIGTPKDISLGQSITKGIISAKRIIEGNTFIQSDVSVNKGNSGGALTNKNGELIGIVNAKLIGYGIEGVSFAIPIYYIEEALKLKTATKP